MKILIDALGIQARHSGLKHFSIQLLKFLLPMIYCKEKKYVITILVSKNGFNALS